MKPVTTRRLTAISGIVGALMLGAYFTAPAFVPRLGALLYSSVASTAQIVAVGSEYHFLLSLGTWLQATGALLCVVFLIGLAHFAAGSEFANRIVLLGCAALVSVVLAEGVFTLTWISAASAGHSSSARGAFDLMSTFVDIFPLVPAPAVYLPLGVILVRTKLLPAVLSWIALALGAGFVLIGFVGIFTHYASIGSAVLASIQDLWILAAAIVFLARQRRLATVRPRPSSSGSIDG